MTTKSYSVLLVTGDTVTIEGVTAAEKDGAGLRFKDAGGAVIASFDDGQAKAHWPSAAKVKASELSSGSITATKG